MDVRRSGVFAPVFALTAALLLTALPACSRKDAAAVVNGDVITKKRLEIARESLARRVGMGSGQAASGSEDPRIVRGALENLIGMELLYQAAVKAGYSVSPEGIDRTIDNLKKSAPTPEAFAKELSDRGITDQMFREDVGRQMVLEKYVENGLGVAAPTDEEIKAFYDQNLPGIDPREKVRASHILIKVASGATDAEKKQALAKATDLAQRARKGENFADLARANSADNSAARGGDLGAFSRGQMVKPFEDAAFSLKVGQVSNPVLSEFGYHVIKVTDRKASGIPSLEEVKPQLVGYLKGRNTQKAVEKKVEDLKKEATIKILVELPPVEEAPDLPSAPAPAATPGSR